MNREDYKIAYENVMLANKMLEQEIERLNKERNKTYENGLNYFLKLQEKKDEIERLNNIINELEKYIHNELILDFYDDNMPCELIINKMENMIKELKGSE
jgi:hypothetical protein